MPVYVSKRKRQCKQTETYAVSVIWQRITKHVCDIRVMQSFYINIYISLLTFYFCTFYLNWQTSPCDFYTLSNFPFIFKHILFQFLFRSGHYEGRTESHKQLFFFACELGTADEGEYGGRLNQLLCCVVLCCVVNVL